MKHAINGRKDVHSLPPKCNKAGNMLHRAAPISRVNNSKFVTWQNIHG